MKKAFTDVKSFVTILFALTVVILLFIAIFKSESLFETVFLLFTNLCTAVFTYFFTKKNTDNIINDNLKSEDENRILKEKIERGSDENEQGIH